MTPTKHKSALPTVTIADPNRDGHVLVINRRDYDPSVHTLASDVANLPAAVSGQGTTPDDDKTQTPPAPQTGADAPAFLQGITLPVLEAMTVKDLQALAKQGDVDPKGMKKAELIETIAAMAKLPAAETEPTS